MRPLFAQGAGPDAALILVVLGCLGIGLIIAICFLVTLQKALSRCHPRNRAMEPGMVWLNLIPLFNIVWQFITVSRIAESLQREFRARGWHRGTEDYGNGVGMASCALRLCGVIPVLGAFLSIAGIICGIIYWVKIANYSGQLARGGYAEYDDYDDDYDRRDSRRNDYDDRDDRRDDRRDDDRPQRPWDRGAR